MTDYFVLFPSHISLHVISLNFSPLLVIRNWLQYEAALRVESAGWSFSYIGACYQIYLFVALSVLYAGGRPVDAVSVLKISIKYKEKRFDRKPFFR